jgi:uncharacterized protein Yka (UPF0111/DUF47 family)
MEPTLKLKTRPDAISKMMSEAVAHLPEATVAFYTIASAKPVARPGLVKKLGKVEREADDVFGKLINKVAVTFSTTCERDGLYRMLETLEEAVDCLDQAGRLIVDFEIQALPPEFVSNAKELVGMSEVARDAVDLMKKPNRMEKALYEIDQHETRLDVGYRTVLRNSLTPDSDPIEALKLKTLADAIEKAASLIEDFSKTLSIVASKDT